MGGGGGGGLEKHTPAEAIQMLTTAQNVHCIGINFSLTSNPYHACSYQLEEVLLTKSYYYQEWMYFIGTRVVNDETAYNRTSGSAEHLVSVSKCQNRVYRNLSKSKIHVAV